MSDQQTANIDIEDILASFFGGPVSGPEQEFQVGDTVTVLLADEDVNPDTTINGTIYGATGTVVEFTGFIPFLGENGYVVKTDVTWDHPEAPSDLERDRWACTATELALA